MGEILDIVLIVVSSLVLVALIVLICVFARNKNKEKEQNFDEASFYRYINELNKQTNDRDKVLSEDLHKFKDLINQNLSNMNSKIDENIKDGFKTNNETVLKVHESLTKIEKGQENLNKLNDEVVNLNSILSNNQTRGRFGEFSLESLLNMIFGDTAGMYEMQHVLKSGKRPDAVVFVGDEKRCLCIDSKFSFTHYAKIFDKKEDSIEVEQLRKEFKSALKAEVTKIADDYTKNNYVSNYAVMYIPSDGIYSYIQSNEDLYESVVKYSYSKSVILSSPSTLQPILANIKQININNEINKNVKEIVSRIGEVKKYNENIQDKWAKFDQQINTLFNKKDEFTKSLETFDKKTDKIIELADKEGFLKEEDYDERL